jgi:hypothetical protein
MAEQNSCCGQSKTCLTVVVVIATLLLMSFLVRQMVTRTTPAPLGVERANARATDNAKIRAEGQDALAQYGYVDSAKGIVRLPVAEAVKLTVDGYKQPAQFRADLSNRVEKATAAAPKPPEKPNQYE